MEKSDKILLSVLTVVVCVTLVLGQVLKKPSVVVVSSTAPAGEKALGYAEGTHLTTFTAENIEATTELKAVAFTTTGDVRASSLVQTGSAATFTTTSAATAANVCDNPVWLLNHPGMLVATTTLPSTTTLFADCLTTVGDTVNLTLFSQNTASTTVLAAGSGGTLLTSSSTTIAAGKGALLRVIRSASATYTALLVNLPN